MKQIRIVTAIERTPGTSLRYVKRVSKTEVNPSQRVAWQPLEIKPHAQLTVTDKIEDKVRVWTAKLVFRTCGDLPERDRYAYRCRLVDGRYRLIGTHESPYPVTSVSEVMPEKVADSQLTEVTVTWQSDRFIPYIRE